MELNEYITLLEGQIKKRTVHAFYNHVVNLAGEYYANISGVGLDELLEQYQPRESAEAFEQRKKLTKSINPALASSLMKPFNKVARNNGIRQFIEVNDKTKEENIRKMMRTFYGSRMESSAGLDYWLKMRFRELGFLDPNSFIVIEWTRKSDTEVLTPRPFEVSSSEAVMFEYKNDELQYLVVRKNITYMALAVAGSEAREEKGFKFTMYTDMNAITYERADPNYYTDQGIALQNNQVWTKIAEDSYIQTINEHLVGFVPAFRVGYVTDPTTANNTFVNPFHSAMCFFRKGLKADSERDLTQTLHAFPQKWQYAEKCKGKDKRTRCEGGKLPGTDTDCSVCKGSGVRYHSSAQDVILMPLPESPDDMFDLDKLSPYKYPPIDLLKWQDEYIQKLAERAHYAVYNSNMFVASEAQFSKTATEVDDNMEGVLDALEPFTEKYSDVWKFIVKTMAILATVDIEKTDININHVFPSDLKLKSQTMLLNELKKANDSGAPSFMIDAITVDLAGQLYNGDDLALKKFDTRHKFYPFNGKGKEEVTMLFNSTMVAEFTKVLYANFEAIFTDIERKYPQFYFMNYPKQWVIVEEITQTFIDELSASKSPQMNFNIPTNEDTGGAGASGGTDEPGASGDPAQPGATDPKVQAGKTGTAGTDEPVK